MPDKEGKKPSAPTLDDPDPKIAFSYVNIASKRLHRHPTGFAIFPTMYSAIASSPYITFGYSDPQKARAILRKPPPRLKKGEKRPLQPTNSGWKIHISIDDSDQANMAKAWDIVKDTLIDYKVSLSKVVRSGKNLATNPDPLQAGKQIVLYQFKSPTLDWAKIMQEITQNLAQAQIKPGPDVPGDRRVPGSHYLYYRNDHNPSTQKSIAADKAIAQATANKTQSYSPFGLTDPLINVRVNVANQPSIPTWQPPSSVPGMSSSN